MAWRIVFEFKPTEYIHGSPYGYRSLLQLTIGRDIGRHGDRTPAIFFNPNQGFLVSSTVNKSYDYHYSNLSHKPKEENWTRIEIGQKKTDSKYIFYVSVNDEKVHSVRNNHPRELTNVAIFAADPWYTPQPGFIRNLSIETRLEGQRKSCFSQNRESL